MRFLLKLVGVLVLAWAGAAAIVYALHHGEDPVRADAVVVLQGSDTRLPLGLRLVESGTAPLLVISRGSRKPLERRLCSGRRKVRGVRVLCFDAYPPSTRGEARFVAHLARDRNLSRIDVVTSKFHVFRAKLIVRRCYHGGLRVVGAPQEDWKLPWDAVTETAKLTYQLLVARDC
jgi:uncharacterized SAM-binding protein YcdF (DUF218 family)